MKTFPLPANEELRLSRLLSCQILDTPAEKEFDELVELVAQISGCTMAFISFMDRDRQWFKCSIGMTQSEAPRNITICKYTILQSNVLLVEDATKDPRFADLPGVAADQGVRFYAGAPIVSSDGHNLGTVCAFDQQPRQMSAEQQRALTIIAAQVTKLLELRIRNILFREHALEQIDMEKKTVQYTLRQQEEERQSIGVELHENFGQVLTACSLYLNMAEEMQGDGQVFLVKARTELGKLINEVRRLSQRVSPFSLHEIDFKEVLAEAVDGIRLHSSLKIELDFKGSVSYLPAAHAITLMRVIMQYLELLRNKKEISSVSIELFMQETVRLSMHYRAHTQPVFSLFERVTINALLNRVESEAGTVEFRDNGIEVVLPGMQTVIA